MFSVKSTLNFYGTWSVLIFFEGWAIRDLREFFSAKVGE